MNIVSALSSITKRDQITKTVINFAAPKAGAFVQRIGLWFVKPPSPTWVTQQIVTRLYYALVAPKAPVWV